MQPQEYATGLTVDSESIQNRDVTLKGVYCKTEKKGNLNKNTYENHACQEIKHVLQIVIPGNVVVWISLIIPTPDLWHHENTLFLFSIASLYGKTACWLYKIEVISNIAN